MNRSIETVQSAWHTSVDWAKEHPNISIAIGTTLGVGLIYGAWKWWNSSEESDEKSEKKSSKWGWVKWVPVVGLAAALVAGGIYAADQVQGWMKDIELFKHRTFGEWKQLAKNELIKAKDHLPIVGKKHEGKKYNISDESYKFAEEKFRETRAKPDEKEIKKHFGLREDQSSPEYEQFVKDMHAKYDVLTDNSVTYARSDVTLHNYETSMIAALGQMREWFVRHEGVFVALALASTYQQGLANIRRLLTTGVSAGVSVALLITKISAEFTMMFAGTAISHPLASLFGFTGLLFGQKATIAAAKNMYLPENFTDFGLALATGQPIAKGVNVLSPIVVSYINKHSDDLKTLTDSFPEWVDSALSKFGDFISNSVPNAMTLKKWQTVEKIHTGSMKSLKTELEARQSEVRVKTSETGTEKGPLLRDALVQLDVFQKSYFACRTEQVTESDEPERALAALRQTLTKVGIETMEEGGVVRWKAEDGTLVDFCVDPKNKDPESIHTLSLRMHAVKDEDSVTFTAFRALYLLREKLGAGMETGERWVTNKTAAIIVGGMLYFTDSEHRDVFWSAPARLVRDLFPGVSWEQLAVDAADATVNAAIITLDLAAIARIKRFIVGGGAMFEKRTLIEMGWAINPLTAPFKVVRDAARGMIDLSIAKNLRTLTGESGRMANILFGRGGIRPEWVGIIDDSLDIKELQYVAKMMKLDDYEKLGIDALRAKMKTHVTDIIKHIYRGRLRHIFTGRKITNYDELRKAVELWYPNRSGVVRGAERVSKAMERSMDVVHAGWRILYDAVAQVWVGKGMIPFNNFVNLFKGIHFPPSLLSAIVKSKGALTMLANAIKCGAPAVQYFMKIATIAQKIAPVAGRAMLGLDVVMCIVEMHANQDRIAGTDNQSLKELYAMQDNLDIAAAASGTAMAVAWRVVGWAPQATRFLALKVGASTFVPAVIAFAAGKYVYGKAEAVTETWLSEQKDWEKKKPGLLRQKMDELGPGKRDYWQGWAGGTRTENWARWGWSRWSEMSRNEFSKWEEGVEKTIQDANSATRYKITRAYAAKMTQLLPGQGESDEDYSQRYLRFQQDQIGFISDATRGMFATSFGNEFQAAHTHAELMALSRALQANHDHKIMQIQMRAADGVMSSKDFDIADYTKFENSRSAIDGISPRDVIVTYQDVQRAEMLVNIAAVRELSPEDRMSKAVQDYNLQNSMLSEVRYDLALCDRNLRTYANVDSLPGWEWSNGLNDSRNVARHGLSIELRSIIRDEAHRMMVKQDLTLEDYKESVGKLSALLQDPNSFRHFYDLGIAKGKANKGELPGDQEAMLTLPWLRENLYVDHPPVSPAAPAAQPRDLAKRETAPETLVA